MASDEDGSYAFMTREQLAFERKALDEIERVANARTMRRINPRSGPDRLYHYTSAAGLAAILSANTFRASRAKSLADKLELKHGISVAWDYIESRLKRRGEDLYARKFLEYTIAFLDGSTTSPSHRVSIDPFVVCFSPDDRGLIHWLHYGQSGDGYAAGFVRSELPNNPFSLIRVMYDEDKQRREFSDAAADFERTIRSLVEGRSRPDERNAVIKIAAHSFSTLITAISVGMKSALFKEEREWRLVCFEIQGELIDKSLSVALKEGFHTVGNRIVPHRLATYPLLPVRSILVGSKVDLPNAREALEYVLRAGGQDPRRVPIDQSAVHLR